MHHCYNRLALIRKKSYIQGQLMIRIWEKSDFVSALYLATLVLYGHRSGGHNCRAMLFKNETPIRGNKHSYVKRTVLSLF